MSDRLRNAIKIVANQGLKVADLRKEKRKEMGMKKLKGMVGDLRKRADANWEVVREMAQAIDTEVATRRGTDAALDTVVARVAKLEAAVSKGLEARVKELIEKNLRSEIRAMVEKEIRSELSVTFKVKLEAQLEHAELRARQLLPKVEKRLDEVQRLSRRLDTVAAFAERWANEIMESRAAADAEGEGA